MPDDALLVAGAIGRECDDEHARARALFAQTFNALGHEFRTPLTTVMSVLDMLEQSGLSAEQRQLVSAAEHAGQRLEAWIDNVGEVIQPGQAKRVPRPRVVDIAAELQPIIEYSKLDAREVGANVEADTSMLVAPRRLCDRRMFRQAMMSLFDSALKCASGGELCLSVADENDRVSIVLGAYGNGWEPSRIAFARRILDNTAPAETSRDGGVGLGLAIARSLAVRMGGDVVLNGSGGQQDVLELTFHAPPSEPLSESDSLSALDVGCKQVMIVEQHAVDQRLLRAMLSYLGHTTTIAPTAADALSHVDAQSFDLIIVGLDRVEDDGFGVVESIRRRGDRLAGVPMMAVVAEEGGALQDRALEAGIDAIVAKPMHLAKLSQAVRRVARWC